jgi:hypothetical protein
VHAGRSCEREQPEYRIPCRDSTIARRRRLFFLSKEDLEDVPTITKYLHGSIRCRFFRPADLLAVALKRHGGQPTSKEARGAANRLKKHRVH